MVGERASATVDGRLGYGNTTPLKYSAGLGVLVATPARRLWRLLAICVRPA